MSNFQCGMCGAIHYDEGIKGYSVHEVSIKDFRDLANQVGAEIKAYRLPEDQLKSINAIYYNVIGSPQSRVVGQCFTVEIDNNKGHTNDDCKIRIHYSSDGQLILCGRPYQATLLEAYTLITFLRGMKG